MRLRRWMFFGVGWLAAAWLSAGLVHRASAQADYPFRDPKLTDDQRIADLQGRLTLDEKVQLMSDHPKFPRLGLVFSGQVEGLHGLALGGPGGWGGRGRTPLPTTTFPQEKGLGATWDPALLKKIAGVEGYEARYDYQNPLYDRGGVVIRAPNADLSRDPRWGRTEESYGEDTFLVGTLTVAFAQGLQGPDPKHWLSASLMKHFLANENEDGRSFTSSDFDERLFREYYSVPFRMGFEQGGSRAVMAAYNSWNGSPMMINPVLKDVMIKEWGNDGLICTDGGALGLLITAHKSFPDKEHGAAAAVKAGINHFLDTYKDDLTKALKDGLVTEADIDAAEKNLLRVYLRLGELDPPGVDPYAQIGKMTQGTADEATPPWPKQGPGPPGHGRVDCPVEERRQRTAPRSHQAQDHRSDRAVDRPGAARLVQRHTAVFCQRAPGNSGSGRSQRQGAFLRWVKRCGGLGDGPRRGRGDCGGG